MKKTYILICTILLTLLIGCNNKTGDTDYINELDKVRAELSFIPKEYNENSAVKEGCFVILNDEVKSKLEIIDKFVTDSQNRKLTSITIIQYTIKGDTVITKIIYDGIKYFGVEYDTKNTIGNSEYHKFEFKYLKVFAENDRKRYYLFNEDKITSNGFFKSMASSNLCDHIDHQFICSYKN